MLAVLAMMGSAHTSEQESLWNDYAASFHDNAKTVTARCATLMGQNDASEQKLPDSLDAQAQFMAARLDALRATSKTLKVLYAVLSDAQKETAKPCSLSAKL